MSYLLDQNLSKLWPTLFLLRSSTLFKKKKKKKRPRSLKWDKVYNIYWNLHFIVYYQLREFRKEPKLRADTLWCIWVHFPQEKLLRKSFLPLLIILSPLVKYIKMWAFRLFDFIFVPGYGFVILTTKGNYAFQAVCSLIQGPLSPASFTSGIGPGQVKSQIWTRPGPWPWNYLLQGEKCSV